MKIVDELMEAVRRAQLAQNEVDRLVKEIEGMTDKRRLKKGIPRQAKSKPADA